MPGTNRPMDTRTVGACAAGQPAADRVGKLPDLVLAQRGDPATARVRSRNVWFAETGFTRPRCIGGMG